MSTAIPDVKYPYPDVKYTYPDVKYAAVPLMSNTRTSDVSPLHFGTYHAPYSFKEAVITAVKCSA